MLTLIAIPSLIAYPRFEVRNEGLTLTLLNLAGVIEGGEPKEVILTSLITLRNKLLLSFREQEALMKDMSYAEATRHRRAHNKLIGEILRFIQAYDENRIIISEYAVKMLNDFIVAHVEEHDKPLADYLAKLG